MREGLKNMGGTLSWPILMFLQHVVYFSLNYNIADPSGRAV